MERLLSGFFEKIVKEIDHRAVQLSTARRGYGTLIDGFFAGLAHENLMGEFHSFDRSGFR